MSMTQRRPLWEFNRMTEMGFNERVGHIGRFYHVPQKHLPTLVRCMRYALAREDVDDFDAIDLKFPRRRVVIMLKGLPDDPSADDTKPDEWDTVAQLI